MNTEPEMERKAKILLYVIGTLQDLKQEGMVSGGANLSEKGYQAYLGLRNAGFRPNDAELKSCMRYLLNRGNQNG